MELCPDLMVGRYRLVRMLGRGGMGVVWRAHDERLDRPVAIKFIVPDHAMDPSFRDGFEREARAISRLDHPNVLTVLDFGEQAEWTYMVSPLIAGGTLAERVIGVPWRIPDALSVLGPLAAALDYAHGERIIHRDVKPQNVLFTDRGRLVLSDFGLARVMQHGTYVSQTRAGVGTPRYISPEQANGARIGPASDLYSLGVIAYQMLTGRPPFEADTPIALALAHVNAPPPPPWSINPALPPAAATALLRMLEKAPAARFRSGAEFVAALSAPTRPQTPPPVWVQGHGPAASPPTISLSPQQTPAPATIRTPPPAPPPHSTSPFGVGPGAPPPRPPGDRYGGPVGNQTPQPSIFPPGFAASPGRVDPPSGSSRGRWLLLGALGVIAALAIVVMSVTSMIKGPAPEPTPTIAVRAVATATPTVPAAVTRTPTANVLVTPRTTAPGSGLTPVRTPTVGPTPTSIITDLILTLAPLILTPQPDTDPFATPTPPIRR